MTIQLLERAISPSQLIVSEVEVEGFQRKCSNPCLSKNVASIDDYIGEIGDGPTDWKLVRYIPASSAWHPARDYLRSEGGPHLLDLTRQSIFDLLGMLSD